MPVQKNSDVVRRLIGRNVLKTEFQSTARKIDDQRPVEIAVAIPAHESDSGSNRAQLVENAFDAEISEMPDFIRIFGNFLYCFRQTIVGVRQDEDTQRLFRCFLPRHVRAKIRPKKN